jgi:hypothetical protein
MQPVKWLARAIESLAIDGRAAPYAQSRGGVSRDVEEPHWQHNLTKRILREQFMAPQDPGGPNRKLRNGSTIFVSVICCVSMAE